MPAALTRYEETRRPATTAILLANRRMDRAERATSAGPVGDEAAELAAITADYRAVVDPRRPTP